MSKKQMNKKKISLKLMQGETAVVLSYDTFIHICDTYDILASEQENLDYAAAYREIADSIRFQSAENYFSESDPSYEEW